MYGEDTNSVELD